MFIKNLATKQPLAPLPNIRVGYVKRRLFTPFLCLILSGCFGGSGGGDSTSSSKKGAKECTTPIPNGKGGLLWNSATKKYGTTCQVVDCDSGFVKNTVGKSCDIPDTGNYVNASGAEVACTDISGIPNFNSWVSGAATDQDSCPFSCSVGYTVSGRTCREYIPQMLALGKDTSRILFGTGEVEAWGRVSTYKWRTHLKEDLGSHTPQALVSGWHHQCIILKNATLNHGSLMCWGQNGDGQLGVGDTNPRTTPTAVTVAVLGNSGDGTPKTVKSVAPGYQHTCALLNDDTVKCWGRNNAGQIGGGTPTRLKTISGTAGDPLSGTATHIAAGGVHTCAVLTTDKSVKCWGGNHVIQTGGGTPNLGTGKTATKIAAGTLFSCAILNDGSVVCWGSVTSPNLGGGKTATKIAAGSSHGCAILNDKSVKCWGSDQYGQVGGGTSGSDRVLRGAVGDPLSGQTATKIAAGYYHTCAIMESDNSVKCWGLNINSGGGLYGQIVGGVAMTGGSDGTGTSTGETATLTAVSVPTATSLDSDEDGQICKITLSGGTLGSNTWMAKNYTTPLTYNGGGSTAITDAIDNLITAIASPVNIAGTNVTFSKSGSDKIAATTDTAVFEGMTLAIRHANSSGDCTSSVATDIPLSGASGGDEAEGLWVISNDYTGSGDKTVNLDSVHIDLGNTALLKEDIADKIVADVAGASWAGKQNVDLPYTATKVQNLDNSDCPVGDYCVLFSRVFKGTEGDYGIPFGDRDYEH